MTTRRPLIGLTGRRKTAGLFQGIPDVLAHLEGDWYYADYARGVLRAGGLPVNLPLDVDPALFLEHLDGILLSGGADIGPERYGAESETDAYPPEPERDAFELSLLDAAVAFEMPVLGICRGLQMINVHAGGTLHQHVPKHARYDIPANSRSHPIDILDGSALASLYGQSHEVNSLHHQTIDQVGADLRVTATDGQHTIEGLEHLHLPIVAVQWHPEMLDTRDTDPLFRWLVDRSLSKIPALDGN